jgi:hypothetical protein
LTAKKSFAQKQKIKYIAQQDVAIEYIKEEYTTKEKQMDCVSSVAQN